MNVRDVAAGVLCIGFPGQTVSDALQAQLAELPVAGLILFARNIESVAQTRTLTDQLRASFGDLAPILATDQEGGRVCRLPS
ncbi:MAG: hypothetical protein NVSMB31_00910 [Vulcanimicrobiaceae bacterium]